MESHPRHSSSAHLRPFLCIRRIAEPSPDQRRGGAKQRFPLTPQPGDLDRPSGGVESRRRSQRRHSRPKPAAVAPHPNLSLVISGTGIAVTGATRQAVRTLGAERVVFGTDVSSVGPVLAVMCVHRSGLSEEARAEVFAGNLHRLWEWTEG
jgi:hypothetical protein